MAFTWSVFADVDESISDVGGEHSSMFSERGRTREERVVQGLWKETCCKLTAVFFSHLSNTPEASMTRPEVTLTEYLPSLMLFFNNAGKI